MPGETANESERVTGDRVSIDYDSTLEFFERRADNAGGDPRITVTSYQDDHPELAERRDLAEWERVRGHLRLDRRPAVIDIGCGVGRWTRHLSGRVSRYFGIDFSPGLADLARVAAAEADLGDSALVQVRSAADVGEPGLEDPGPFGLVIVSGVLTYLNDADVERCVQGIARLTASDAVVYVREPVGLIDRLTLRGHWSTELKDRYSAVYRPADHYRRVLHDALVPLGFVSDLDEPLDANLQNRAETSQHFFVLSRTGEEG